MRMSKFDEKRPRLFYFYRRGPPTIGGVFPILEAREWRVPAGRRWWKIGTPRGGKTCWIFLIDSFFKERKGNPISVGQCKREPYHSAHNERGAMHPLEKAWYTCWFISPKLWIHLKYSPVSKRLGSKVYVAVIVLAIALKESLSVL